MRSRGTRQKRRASQLYVGAQVSVSRYSTPAMYALLKLFLAIVPLLLTLLLAWLTMEGRLNFGGGEKDLFIAVPLLLWSLVYLCCYLTLWWRRSSTARLVAVSSGVATGVVAVAWAVLFVFSWFRFR